MSGRPMGNLSHDHSCNSIGHPRIADFVAVREHALHIPRYVAAKTAEPQLRTVMWYGCVALAISNAMGMYRALIVVTWFSVNITFPSSHIRYASRLLVIWASDIWIVPKFCICNENNNCTS